MLKENASIANHGTRLAQTVEIVNQLSAVEDRFTKVRAAMIVLDTHMHQLTVHSALLTHAHRHSSLL